MDAKEAIENLKNYPMYNYYFPDTKISQATRLAISALEKVETLETENARLKQDANKWNSLLKQAGAVGLNEADFFKMVETDKE